MRLALVLFFISLVVSEILFTFDYVEGRLHLGKTQIIFD